MSDSIKLIRESMEACIEALPGGFIKLDNKFDLTKNNFSNEDKRYGVIAKESSQLENGVLRYLTYRRNFEITLANKFISTNNGDEQQQDIGDLLESFMENVSIKLTDSKAGLPSLVLNINFTTSNEIDYLSIENLASLVFNIDVDYRKLVTEC